MTSPARDDRASVKERPSFARKRVLIADDESELLSILSEQLGYEGYLVFTAHNGRAAWEKFQKYRFDAVVLDLTMPLMDGVEVVKAIRSRDPHVFILIFSAALDGPAVKAALAAGADKHLAKPFGIRDLIESLKKI